MPAPKVTRPAIGAVPGVRAASARRATSAPWEWATITTGAPPATDSTQLRSADDAIDDRVVRAVLVQQGVAVADEADDDRAQPARQREQDDGGQRRRGDDERRPFDPAGRSELGQQQPDRDEREHRADAAPSAGKPVRARIEQALADRRRGGRRGRRRTARRARAGRARRRRRSGRGAARRSRGRRARRSQPSIRRELRRMPASTARWTRNGTVLGQPAHERAPARRADLLGPARLGEQQAQRLVPGAGDEHGAVLGGVVGAGQARADVDHVVGAVPGARRVDERAAELAEGRAALLLSDAVHEEHGAVVPLGCPYEHRGATWAA